MISTYLVSAVGIFIGFITVFAEEPSLTWAALLAVGCGGVLSFIRHTLVPRSDGVRMGWESEKLNPFQLETGAANLAWALLAFGAVIFGWGLAVEAASFLVFGLYMLTAAVIQVVVKRKLPIVVASLSFGVAMSIIGIIGLNAAG
jgi:hypothetical protein